MLERERAMCQPGPFFPYGQGLMNWNPMVLLQCTMQIVVSACVDSILVLGFGSSFYFSLGNFLILNQEV